MQIGAVWLDGALTAPRTSEPQPWCKLRGLAPSKRAEKVGNNFQSRKKHSLLLLQYLLTQ